MADRIAFSADDRTVYSALDQDLIQIWDVETGAPRGGLHGISRGAWALAASPDGRTIASASRDGLVELWDPLPQQAADYKLKLTPGAVPARIQFSSDSKRLLVFERSSGLAVTHWDVETGVKLRTTPLDPAAYTFSAAFTPDGRLLAIAGRESMITILDVDAGETTKLCVPALKEVRSMIFSPDNHELFVEGRTETGAGAAALDLANGRQAVAPWNATTENSCWTHSSEVFTLFPAVSRVGWWNPATGSSRVITCESGEAFGTPSLSRDGKLLITFGYGSRRLLSWSASDMKLDRNFLGHLEQIACAAISPSGDTLASSSFDRTIRLWDIATGEELLTFDGFVGTVQDMHFSLDGKALAALAPTLPGQPGEIRIWLAGDDEPEPVAISSSKTTNPN